MAVTKEELEEWEKALTRAKTELEDSTKTALEEWAKKLACSQKELEEWEKKREEELDDLEYERSGIERLLKNRYTDAEPGPGKGPSIPAVLEALEIETLVRQVENEFGVPMVGSKVAEPSRIGVRWEGLSASQRNEVRDFLTSLDLGVDPVFIVPDPDDSEAYFGRLQQGWMVNQIQPNNAAIDDVTFLTDGFGLVTA